MAKLRASSAFDMRVVIPSSGTNVVAQDRITVVGGTRGTTITGDIDVVGLGVKGTVAGFSQVLGSALVFTATGVERSAATVFEILGAHDNDRFLAYTLSGDDNITGSAAADYLIGFGGADTIAGGGGNDSLFGGSGRDTLIGGAGNDFLAGGLLRDVMNGGTGNDTYLVANASDVVLEAAASGTDTVLSHVTYTLTANVESLVLIGARAINGIGDGDADSIRGNSAANVLAGAAGGDQLDGAGGADTLLGGSGRDILKGGAGADTFRFRSAAEASGDHILDFTHRVDHIDVARIDANTTKAGNQAFHFIGEAAFTGHAGELSSLGSWLRGDLNGDKITDFTILLVGDPVLSVTDFIL